MAAVPEYRSTVRTSEETFLSLIHIRVNQCTGLAFIHQRIELNVAPDAPAEQIGLCVQPKFFNHRSELQDRVGLGQDNPIAHRGILLCQMSVPGDEYPACRIRPLDQVMGAYAHVPVGIIPDNAQVFSQPDDHVVYHKARFGDGRLGFMLITSIIRDQVL